MPDLHEGETVEVQGSAAKPYLLKLIDGVYSCSCAAWRNQSAPIDRRSCKHLRKLRGEAAEQARLGELPAVPSRSSTRAGKPAAPPLLLAQSWNNSDDLTGYWLSEKLDGVRAYWTGKQFLSRGGNPFAAPAWFIADLPPWPLDGELWLGRGAFQRAVSIVRRQDGGQRWTELEYVVFDAPQADGPFESRMARVHEQFRQCPPEFAQVLRQQRCRGTRHLQEELQQVLSGRGEGLMLRQPGSLYEFGRSHTLLKVKQFRTAEGVVCEQLPGKGRHRGRLGALLLQLPDGTTVSVGSGLTDRDREQPPAVGSLVEFSYQELTDGGVPRFPVFVRVRRDLARTLAGSPR
jgi:DNA ligase-1